MKQTIRLTERQFHNMVKECVKSFLNERDANGNMLYTFYVETLENDKEAGHYHKASRLARNSNDALQQIVGDFDKKGLSVHGVEFANQKEPSVNEGRIYNPIEKVQSLIDTANNAYVEASKHTQDKWCLMDKEGNSYGLESPIALKRGYVIINYDDPYHAYADNQIRVLTRQNGKDVLFNGDYYDEGWKDAKRELNRIIKDAERGKQYFEQYNPNWETPESQEAYRQSKSDMRGFNKAIGLKADTGVDSIERRFLKETGRNVKRIKLTAVNDAEMGRNKERIMNDMLKLRHARNVGDEENVNHFVLSTLQRYPNWIEFEVVE